MVPHTWTSCCGKGASFWAPFFFLLVLSVTLASVSANFNVSSSQFKFTGKTGELPLKGKISESSISWEDKDVEEKYPVVPYVEQRGQCGDVIVNLTNGDAGMIQSPNYPKKYPASAECEWRLEADPDSRIQVTLFDIRLRSPTFNGLADSLSVTLDGNWEESQRFSGDLNGVTPFTLISEAHRVSIRFKSAPLSLGSNGFRMGYFVHSRKKPAALETSNSAVAIACQVSPIDLPQIHPEHGHSRQTREDFIKKEFSQLRAINRTNRNPHLVALVLDDEQFCSGTLVKDNFVLTTAHCTSNVQKIEMIFGTEDITLQDAGVQRRVANSSAVRQHPFFDRDTGSHDVSLIKLAKPVFFTKFVKAVRMPELSHIGLIFNGFNVEVSGWGDSDTKALSEGGSVYAQSRSKKLLIGPNAACRSSVHKGLNGLMMCSRADLTEGVCQADSGSPVTARCADNVNNGNQASQGEQRPRPRPPTARPPRPKPSPRPPPRPSPRPPRPKPSPRPPRPKPSPRPPPRPSPRPTARPPRPRPSPRPPTGGKPPPRPKPRPPKPKPTTAAPEPTEETSESSTISRDFPTESSSDSSSLATDSSSDSSSLSTDSSSDSSSLSTEPSTDFSSPSTDSSSLSTDSSGFSTDASSDSSSLSTDVSSPFTDSSSLSTDAFGFSTDASSPSTDASSLSTDSNSFTESSSFPTSVTDSSSFSTSNSESSSDSSLFVTESSTFSGPSATESSSTFSGGDATESSSLPSDVPDFSTDASTDSNFASESTDASLSPDATESSSMSSDGSIGTSENTSENPNDESTPEIPNDDPFAGQGQGQGSGKRPSHPNSPLPHIDNDDVDYCDEIEDSQKEVVEGSWKSYYQAQRCAAKKKAGANETLNPFDLYLSKRVQDVCPACRYTSANVSTAKGQSSQDYCFLYYHFAAVEHEEFRQVQSGQSSMSVSMSRSTKVRSGHSYRKSPKHLSLSHTAQGKKQKKKGRHGKHGGKESKVSQGQRSDSSTAVQTPVQGQNGGAGSNACSNFNKAGSVLLGIVSFGSCSSGFVVQRITANMDFILSTINEDK